MSDPQRPAGRVGFVTEPILPNERLREVGHDLIPSSFGEALGAAADAALNAPGSLRSLSAREAEMQAQGLLGRTINPRPEFGDITEIEDPFAPPLSRELQPEEANETFGVKGELTFKKPVREETARLMREWKNEELARKDTLRRASDDLLTTAATFTTGLLASALDPINVASAFLPVVGPARYAIWASRYGQTPARALRGAVEGAAGAAVIEPLALLDAGMSQHDYDATDSLLNIAFGTILGGGLHVAGGAIKDRFQASGGPLASEGAELPPTAASRVAEAPQPVRESALRVAVGQMAEGRAVEVEPVVRGVARDGQVDTPLAEVARLQADLTEIRQSRAGTTIRTDLLPDDLPGASLADLELVREAGLPDLVLARAIERGAPEMAAALRAGDFAAVNRQAFAAAAKRVRASEDIRPAAVRAVAGRLADDFLRLEPARDATGGPASMSRVAAALRVRAALRQPGAPEHLGAVLEPLELGARQRLRQATERPLAPHEAAAAIERAHAHDADTASSPTVADLVATEARKPARTIAEEVADLERTVRLDDAEAAAMAEMGERVAGWRRAYRAAAVCLLR